MRENEVRELARDDDLARLSSKPVWPSFGTNGRERVTGSEAYRRGSGPESPANQIIFQSLSQADDLVLDEPERFIKSQNLRVRPAHL